MKESINPRRYPTLLVCLDEVAAAHQSGPRTDDGAFAGRDYWAQGEIPLLLE